MKDKFVTLYMDFAERVAELSYCQRLKVGCVIISPEDDRLFIGYNGTPPGEDNACEIEVDVCSERGEFEDYTELRTKDNVIHAEQNALDKITRSTGSSVNAIMFCTHAPCIQCAKRIVGSKISRLYYKYVYRETAGLEYLTKMGIEIKKIDDNSMS